MATKVDSNVEVTLQKVRLSFEHVFRAQTPKPDKDGRVGTATFNCSFLIDKKDGKTLDLIEDAIAECKEKMWGKNPPKIRSDRTPYKDGDDYEYEGYEGHMVVSARNQKKPKVVHSKKDDDGRFIVLDGTEGVIYSGCLVNGIVRFWAQDSVDYGKRINCSLEVVQFYKDGQAFSGAAVVDADEKLAGLEGEVEDEDPRGTRSRRESRGREDEDRPARGRDRDEERPARGRDRDEERPARGRDRDEEKDERPSRSARDDESSGNRRASTRDDDDRGSRRSSRGEDDDRPARRGSRSDERDNLI